MRAGDPQKLGYAERLDLRPWKASHLVEGVKSQVERVARALDDSTLPVTGVLCFLGADWPLIGGSFSVDGVHVFWPRLLIQRMTEAAPADIDIDSIHSRLSAAFPGA